MCISTAVVASAFPLCMVFIKNMLRGKPGLGMSSIVRQDVFLVAIVCA